MHNIKVLPSYKIIQVEDNELLIEALKQNGFMIKSTCGRHVSCADCVVKITEATELDEPSFEEKQLIGNVFHLTQERLSCQLHVQGNLTVDISAHLNLDKKISRPLRRTKEQAKTIIMDRKEKSKNRPQRPGGLKRPKAFKTSKEE